MTDPTFLPAWRLAELIRGGAPANQEELGQQLMQLYHVQSNISCSTCHR